MERTRTAEQAVLGLAADTLDALVETIISRWLERVGSTIYAAHPELNRQKLIDHAPELMHGVAEALRRGQPEAQEAPWTAPAREHALVRLRQHTLLGDLVREYQMMREEIWRALRRHLAGIPAEDVYDIAESLDAALDTMASIATGTYGTERERVEQALRLSEQQFRKIFEEGPLAMAIVGLDYRLQRVNPRLAQLLGYREQALVGRTLADLTHPDDIAKDLELLGRLERGEIPYYAMEKRYIRQDGQVIWGTLTTALVHDDEGRPLYYLGMVEDISARKQAEAERERLLAEVQREAEARRHLIGRLNTLLRATTEILKESTVQGLLEAVAGTARQLGGAALAVSGYGHVTGSFRLGAASRTSTAAICPPGEEFRMERGGVHMELIYGRESIRLSDEEMRRHPRWWGLPPDHGPLRGLLGARMVDREGNPNGLIMMTDKKGGEFTAEDETLLRQLAAIASLGLQQLEARDEAERRASELDATLDAISDGLIIYSPKGKILRMNRAAERIMEVSWEAYRAMSLEERVRRMAMTAPDGRPLAPDEIPAMRALRGETVSGYRMAGHRDGRPGQVLVSAAPIRDTAGRIVGAAVSFADITPLIELQEQRDDILRAVSHDLRNPLTAVLGPAQVLERRLAKAGLERERESAQTIFTAAQRMNTMIQDLVDSARSESGQLKLDRRPVELRTFVHNLKEQLAASLETARIEVRIPEGLPPVSADPARLERILTNLWSNALKYSAPGTPVTVSARQEDGWVITSITDRGPGIPPEDTPHLFERYFRAGPTRGAGPGRGGREGVGLGLYITRTLVEAHGGRVWVESEVGVGSTFSFSLSPAA